MVSSFEQHPFFQYHLDRLALGAQRLGLELNQQFWIEQVNQLRQQLPSCIIKTVLTRKGIHRGYKPTTMEADLMVTASQWSGEFANCPISVKRWEHTLSEQPLLAGLKHLNRLENVLAAMHIDEHCQEVLMCDQRHNLIEGTKSNVFVLSDGKWHTPLLDACGVKGVVRAWLLDTFEISQTHIPYQQLSQAQAVFMSNSVIGICPLRAIEGRALELEPVEKFQAAFLKAFTC